MDIHGAAKKSDSVCKSAILLIEAHYLHMLVKELWVYYLLAISYNLMHLQKDVL